MKTHRKGFTLIELMVVMSIISMLASITISALSGARTKAQDVVTVAGINQLRTAVDSYYFDHGDYPLTQSASHDGLDIQGTTLTNTLLTGKYISAAALSNIPPGFQDTYVHRCSTTLPEFCPSPNYDVGNPTYPFLSPCDNSRNPQAAILFQLNGGVSSQYPVWGGTFNILCFY